jgi:peptide/nickel transport system substrate-binding protein
MLDRVELRFYPSYEHTIAAYEAGEVMGFGPILAEDMDRARANSSLQILSARLSEYSLIYLNLENPGTSFFQDKRVRQALLYALDRQKLIDQVLQGQGMIIHSPMLPQSWAFDPEVKRYLYDPERALELLENARWVLPDPNKKTFDELDPEDAEVRVKDGQQLEFTLITNEVPNQVALAHAVAEQWGKVGVRVHVQAVSMSELTLSHLIPREFDAALLQWQAQPDPDPYPMWHSTQREGGQNYSGFDNRDADEAIEVARQLSDRSERTKLYQQFQAIFAEEVPAILLYQPIYAYGVDRQVRNAQIAPMSDPSGRFRNLFRWAVLEKEVSLAELNDQVGDKLDKRGDP